MAIPISAYMITFNNERTVDQAIQSLTWADEIVVVDSHSSDRTPEIARKYATTFIQRDWPGFREQYQFAADQCSHDWAVFLDADEVFPNDLQDEVRTTLAKNLNNPATHRVDGYYMARRTWYLGRWIDHGGWVPDREIRLYDRHKGKWVGGLHAAIQVEGRRSRLTTPCRHYTYGNISDHLQTIDRYSATAASDMVKSGKRFSYTRTLFSPPWRFFRDYVIKGGFRDGFPGLVIAVATAFFVFIKNAKLREVQKDLFYKGEAS